MLKVTRSQLPDSPLISSLVPMPLLKAALLSAVMGWLILQGQRAGIYDTGLAVPLVTIASTVAFAVSFWQIAETLERIDAERQRASQALQQSQERYRAFVEQSSEGIWRFELEEPMPTSYSEDEQIEHFYQYGYLAECNDVMAQMYGFSGAEEIVGVRLGNFVVRSEPHNIEYLRSFIRSGYRLIDAESHEVDKLGASKYFLNNLVGIVENGALLRAWGTQRDITSRKRFEEEQRRSEEHLRSVLQNMPVMMDAFDADWNIIIWNRECERVTGYTAQEIIGNPRALELLYPDAAYRQQMLAQWIARGNDYRHWEWDITCKDGSVKTVSWSNISDSFPIPGWAGWGIGVDITERKQASEALQESESRLRCLVESNLMGIMSANFQGQIIEANDAWLNILGYTREEVLAGTVNFLEITPPEHRHLDWQAMEEMKRTGSHTPFEKEYIRKDGTRVPVLVGTAYLGGPQNTGVGFALDLTELKRAKASLRQLTKQVQEQANTLDAILSASVDHIYIIDCAGRYKYVSAGGAQVLGFKAIDVIGKTWRDLGLPSDIMQALDEQREKVISTGQPLKREVDFSTPSGVRHYEYIIAPFYKDKSVEGIVVISRDTTERKQTETALQESEERFRTLVEQSPFSTQILAPDGQTIQVNRAWEKLWGLTLDQLPEYNMLLDQQLVDKGVMPYIKKGFAGECLEIPAIVYDPEVTIPDRSIHKDPQRWVRGFIYPVKDRDGSIREVVVVHEDISARKRAEEALALSEAKFRRLVDSNIIGVIIADYTGNIIEANDAFLQMLGYTRPELVAGNIDWRAMTPLEYLPQDLRAIEEFKQTGACAPFEKEYIHSDGSRVPVLVGGAALEGLPDTTICFVLDLSSRKQAESKLKESEERFRLLAEKVRIIPWQADARSGNFTYVGPQTVEILGYPLEEWYTDNFWGDRMHPQDREWAIKYCVDCSATLDNYEFEYRMLSADGKSVWLYDIVNVVRDENGPQILRGFMIDITHRKQAEEALQKREDELRLITNAVPVLISYVDSKQQYRFNNKLYEQWYGFPASSAYGKHIKEVIGESAYLTIRPQIEAVLSGQEVTFESKLPLQDAGNRYIRATYVPQFGEQGEVEGFVALISDISARKQAEEALQETNQALQALIVREQAARESAEAANRMKDEFLATLSHELRTPLNPIQGWIHLLRTRKFDSAATARALETIDRNTKLLTQLIEDVLDVSRIITGKLRLNVSPIELVPVIQAAIDTVQPAADAKEIRIESILDFSAGKVLGDTNRLQQVIWNLLSNAVKFTPKGGRVEVQLSIDSLYVQIRVSDTGKGISTEFLPYVFERFRQADASITRAYGGLGLGLAIVRHLVELHGGTVCAQSPGEGQGATFVVNLPLLEMRRVGEEEIGKVAASPSHLLTPASTHPLDGLRVLVVDDEADARELLVAILAEDGAEVIAVASAAEAIDALQRLQPNILVSDIGMPGEDGYTLMRKVRALDAEQGGQIPAVALTAYARASDRTEALNAGFQLHVPKPVNAAELALALAKLAGRTGNLTR